MKGKTYKLTTIKDLGDVVTKKNLPFLIADLKNSLEALMAMDAVNKATCKRNGTKYSRLMFRGLTWTDDGKSKCKEIVLNGPDGAKLVINENSFNPLI